MSKRLTFGVVLFVILTFLVFLFSYYGVMAGFTAVITLTTIIYTWVTYGLLESTKASVASAQLASQAAEKAYRANSVLAFTTNKRELDFYLLDHSDVRSAVYAEKLSGDPDHKAKIFADAWWLHTARFYRLLKSEMLPNEDWASLRYGVRTLLSLPVMKAIWNEIRDGYESDFRNFVDDQQKKLERETPMKGIQNEA